MDTLFPSVIADVLLIWLLLFVTILHKGMCNLRVQCNEKDHHVLLNFKHAVVDPSAILSTWSEERDCCEWTGVQCDNTSGRVIELNLRCHPEYFDDDCGNDRSHCLTGELHLSLLQLEFLNYLDLSFNNFQAIIQNDFADLTYCNNLSMFRPPNSCENSSNLYHLDLSHNEDLHIDNLHWLSLVPHLEYLSFSGINLQRKVDWLQLGTLLPSLTKLHLSNCQLRDINPRLKYANFTSLQVLSLDDNAFGTGFIPDWLFNLSDVTNIDLSYNYFQGQLPERLLNLRKIQFLELKSNKFTGPIPYWFGQFEHLQVLDIGENSFSGPIPLTLGNLSSLIVLEVSLNHLNGSLPESLGQLLNLEVLGLGDNHLTGDVSERNFVRLSNLKILEMGSPGLIFNFDSLWIPPFQLNTLYLVHMMGPKLPAWLYTQTSLSTLGIANSTISFESHDKFWDFATQVEDIGLEDNIIDADMSNVLLNSSYITLDSNKFKGSLPRLSPNVLLFSAASNSFQGSISPLLCPKMDGRSQLKYLDLSNNFLSGKLTNCWMTWKSLAVVLLHNNNLTGTIPPSMNFLSNLTVLSLNKNNLSGEISQLKIFQNLQILDVGENKFSGSIPNWIGHNAKVLQLRSNQLSGSIPPQICQLASLIILDFAENKISGSIPLCLYNMTAMAFSHSSYNRISTLCIGIPGTSSGIEEVIMLQIKGQMLRYKENLNFMRVIDLSSNNMSGTIPLKIFSLTDLYSLNLSHNQFEGSIPKEIGNLKQLESLDLANNQLSGEIPQSMAELSFLGFLNLSFNNFSGKIPSGTQLQRFEAFSYIGNPELCGAPLPKNCTDIEDVKPIEESDNKEVEFLSSFYTGIGVGFATGFWGVCSAIFFNRNFRHSYFRFLYVIRDKLYVLVVLMMNRFR